MTTRRMLLGQMTGGFVLILGGCGGGGGGGDGQAATAPATSATCMNFNFSANHGHTLSIPVADLDSTSSKTYDVQGTAPHNHKVTLTAAQLAQLKAGQAIAVVTSRIDFDDQHFHDMSGRCA